MRNRDSNIRNGLIVLTLLTGIITIATSSPDLSRKLSRNFNNNVSNIKAFIGEKLPLDMGESSKNNLVSTYGEYLSLMEETLAEYSSDITIAVKDYDRATYNEEAFLKVLETNPIAGPSFSCYMTTEELGDITLMQFKFKYPEDKEVLKSKDREVRDKVTSIVNELVKPEMKDYEKEKVLHDYVVNNSKYDERLFSNNMPEESYTAYGVLIDGLGVCQGYAVAMNMLLNEAGVESLIITGDSWSEEANNYISHAWNLVKIQGEYYHLDATWNDPLTEDGRDVIRYSYFNVTDDQIRKNHRWDKSKFPPCDSYEYSFNNLNFVEQDIYGNDIAVAKDYNEFFNLVKADVLERNPSGTYKILNFDDNEETIKSNISRAYEELYREGEYAFYYWVDEMFLCGYVTVEFKQTSGG